MQRRDYPTREQKARLLELIEDTEELWSGKYSATFTITRAETLWKKIADDVNSIPGAIKNWKCWRKTWQDMKSKRKKRQLYKAQSSCKVTNEASSPGNDVSTTHINIQGTANETSSSHIELECKVEVDDPLIETNKSEGSFEEVNLPEDLEEKPNPPYKPQVIRSKRKVAKPRLHHTMKSSDRIERLMEQKLAIKREFYTNYIAEMKKQTEALTKIANNISRLDF